MLNREKIGKTIAFYRKEQGMTQKDLAERLHISYQAVSKWESGVGLPTVEMLTELSECLNISIDAILNNEGIKNRRISYMDAGLNTKRLCEVKADIADMVTDDEALISARYADAVLFQVDTAGYQNPVYSILECHPGSKIKLAQTFGYEREICMDTAASGMNHLLQHGMKPLVLKAQVLCAGSRDDLYYHMAQAFKTSCEENDVLFAGMEIAAQPMNFKSDEYYVSAALVGITDREQMPCADKVQEGDVIIGIRTEGIEGTSYPFIKVMTDRNPELLYQRLGNGNTLLDEIMKPNAAYTQEIMLLQCEGLLHGACRVGNHLFNPKLCATLPRGLGACIDLSAIPVTDLYRFLYRQDMIGENVFHYHFHFGIGMLVIVPDEKKERAMELIRDCHDCCCIGRIKRRDGIHMAEWEGESVWSEGSIQWEQ